MLSSNKTIMLVEELPRISPDGIHYLDFGAYPQWLMYLYETQLKDREVNSLAHTIGVKIQKRDGVGSRLRKIQQYIHDKTYHIRHQDRVNLFGHIPFESIPYPNKIIVGLFDSVRVALAHNSFPGYLEAWEEDWNLNRVVGTKIGSLSASLELSPGFRDVAPLGCAEEATLAAALVLMLTNISEDRLAFFISPVHVICFVRPTDDLPKGCIFDSKMLCFPKDAKKLGSNVSDRKFRILSKLGNVWSVASTLGITSTKGVEKLESPTTVAILREFDNFLED